MSRWRGERSRKGKIKGKKRQELKVKNDLRENGMKKKIYLMS